MHTTLSRRFTALLLVVPLSVVACEDGPKPKPPAPPTGMSAQPPAPPGDSGAGAMSGQLPPSHPPIGNPVGNQIPDASGWRVSTATDDPTKIEIAGLEMPKPATWVWQQPTMQFRVLQYSVPGSGDSKDAAELVFNQDIGGGVEGNVNRWKGQFKGPNGAAVEPKVETKKIGDLEITIVELRGAYAGMGMPGPREGTLQLGAMINGAGRNVFVRLNGPEKTVEAERANWDKMISEIKVK